jgi:putative ABC transport system substrate-binding protein
MKRRDFITMVGGMTAWSRAARAQQPAGTRLIGVLMGYEEGNSATQSWLAAFRGTLAKLGWTEGSNLRIELRWGAGDADKAKTVAKELVDLQPDAILTHSTPMAGAVARETHTIPVVFVNVADPIGGGFATSLAHPGGNMTGFANFEPEMGGKWLELLKEIAPRTRHVALLFNPATAPALQFYMSSIQAAALSFAIQASAAPVYTNNEIEGVIAEQARNPGGGLIVLPDSFNMINRDLIIALAARYGVPTIYFTRFFTESGGLIAYGTDFVESFSQAAGYIDRILKGERPADLPIQLLTKFEFVINLKTAKALDLDVPPHLQQLADQVIE